MKKKSILLFLMAFLLILSGCGNNGPIQQIDGLKPFNRNFSVYQEKIDYAKKEKKLTVVYGGGGREAAALLLQIDYIDVGQADAALLQSDGHYMLIDAGDYTADSVVTDYLKNYGATKLDYVIATHPHADHIGGMRKVVDNFEIEKIYMPKVAANTKTFEWLLVAIKNKGIKISEPQPGTKFYFNGMLVEILAPVKSYENDINDNSIVLKVTCGDRKFLFTGDIETEAEQDILNKGTDVSADVLKVAHHGSDTSSTQDFLNAVEPDYAIISVGRDNQYGHPVKSVLEALEAIGAVVYRTDTDGTIIVTTNGKTLEVVTETDGKIADEPEQFTEREDSGNYYIGNLNTKKFHKPNCNSLPAEENQKIFDSREQAIEWNYTPCKRCNP